MSLSEEDLWKSRRLLQHVKRHISRPSVLTDSPVFARSFAVIQLFVLTGIQFVGDLTNVRLAVMEESRPKDGGVRFVCLFVFLLTAHSIDLYRYQQCQLYFLRFAF